MKWSTNELLAYVTPATVNPNGLYSMYWVLLHQASDRFIVFKAGGKGCSPWIHRRTVSPASHCGYPAGKMAQDSLVTRVTAGCCLVTVQRLPILRALYGKKVNLIAHQARGSITRTKA
jgi:hypothetical protein